MKCQTLSRTVALLAAGLLGYSALAATVQVADATGNASTDTSAIQSAVNSAGSGGTVELGTGVYVVTFNDFTVDGRTLKGKGWEKTVIKSTGSGVNRGIKLKNGGVLQGVTVTGFVGGYRGAGVYAENGTVSWCCVSNNTSTATDTGNSAGSGICILKGTIDHCLVANNVVPSGKVAYGAGIGGLVGGSDGSKIGAITIDSCLVCGNVNNGSKGGGGIAFASWTQPITIRNCTIAGNSSSVGVGGLYCVNTTGGSVTLVNNIITGNKLADAESNVSIKASFLNTSGSSNCIVTGTATGSDPYKDASLVSALSANGFSSAFTPGFVDAANGDYHLNAGSPAAAAGVTYTGIDKDLDNVAFADTPSLGCYQADTTPTVAKPSFDPGATTFYPSIAVTLACATEDSSVYYTTDGSDPAVSGIEYTAPVELLETATIRAIGVAEGMATSKVVSATYTLTPPADPAFGTVTTAPTARKAVISGKIASVGNLDATACDVYFACGVDPENLPAATRIATAVASDGTFTTTLSGLDPETVYCYELTASNNATYATGVVKSGTFTTTAVAGTLVPGATAAATRQTIQNALDDAALADPAGTVTLGEGLFQIDSQLEVKGGVTLVGQGMDKTIVKQTASVFSGSTRVVNIAGGSTVSRVTLTGGNVSGNYVAGGGALITDGTISWCCVTNNAADTGNNKYGGGVAFYEGKGRVDHSIIANNRVRTTAGDWAVGAGIGVRKVSGPVVIESCLVRDNVAVAPGDANRGYGGGIGVDFQYSNNDVKILNTTIVRNTAGQGGVCKGGAVFSAFDTKNKLTMLNCVIADNVTANSDDTVSLSNTNVVDFCCFDVAADAIGENSVSGEPAFVDAANNDFHLSGASPASGAGVAWEGIGTDLDGTAFANPPSMGCYEVGVVTESPTIDPVHDTAFYPTTNVTITCATDGAKIYYTTDGTLPNESSAEYTAPIALSATTTIKARAYAAGMGPSAVVTAVLVRAKPTPKTENFKKSVEITLNAALSATEITGGLPALVRLSESTVSGFDYDDFSLPNGGDMMFVNAANGRAIPHEVDTWETDGESLVWVKLPSSAANTKVILYYGYGATSSAEASDVWTDYVGVWHLGEATAATDAYSAGTYANSTAVEGIDGHVAAESITGETGSIGKCFRVNNVSAYNGAGSAAAYNYGGVYVNDSGTDSPIDGGQHFTISGFFKHGDFNYFYDHVFYKRLKSNTTTENSFSIECNSNNGSNPQIYPRGSSNDGFNGLDEKLGWVNAWGYITFVYDGTTCSLYKDGVLKGSGTITACVDNDYPLVFGNNANIASGLAGDAPWCGWIDEVRFSKGSMTAEQVAAEYAAMNLSGTDVFAYGAAQDVEPATTVRRPVFDPAATVFYTPTSVTLTSETDGAAIYYTTDGSEPTESSTLYEGPIAVSETVTITARAFKPEMDPSAIVSATYSYVVPVAPTLGTVTVTPMSRKASVAGTVTSLGNLGATACDVYFSLDGAAATKVAEGVTDSFSFVISDLTAETTYAYTLSISNNAAIVSGAETSGSFTTTALPPGLEPIPGDPAATRALIQEAIDAAAGESPAGTVRLSLGTFELNGELTVSGGVKLIGQGWSETIIRQTVSGQRCMTIKDGSVVEGMTITGGSIADAGAGALVKNGTISWCKVIGNTVKTGSGNKAGAGISFSSGHGQVDHSIVSGNVLGGGWGAGIGAVSPDGDILIDACLIFCNTNNAGSSGGVAIDNTSKTTTVRNCTIVANKASGNTGGLYSNNGSSGKLILVNDIVTGNLLGSTEVNVFVQNSHLDTANSSNCVITGTYSGNSPWKDVTVAATLAGSSAVAPTFVNAAAYDYHLVEGSSGIGAGVTYSGIGVDLDKRAFAATPTIGCYEFFTGAPSRGLLILFK